MLARFEVDLGVEVFDAQRIFFSPRANFDAALACWLRGGNDPHAQEEDNDADGDKGYLVRSQAAELVIEDQAI